MIDFDDDEDGELRPCAFEQFPLALLTLSFGLIFGFTFACGVALAFNLVAQRGPDSDAPERVIGAVGFSFGLMMLPLSLFAVQLLRKKDKLPTGDTLPMLLVAIGFAGGVITGFGMLWGFDMPTLHHLGLGAALMVISVIGAVVCIMLIQCYRDYRRRRAVEHL